MTRVTRLVPLVRLVPFVLAVALFGCSKSEPTATGPRPTNPPTTDPAATTTTGGNPSTTLASPTTTLGTTTTVGAPAGTFAITPAGTRTFGTSFPYPIDASQPTLTPVLDWSLTLSAGQKLEIRGPAPGTADALLSSVTKGQFVPCPGAITAGACASPAGTYTYRALVLDPDGTVVAKTTAILEIAAGSGSGGGSSGGI